VHVAGAVEMTVVADATLDATVDVVVEPAETAVDELVVVVVVVASYVGRKRILVISIIDGSGLSFHFLYTL
jgi:hypothetical protein